MIIKQYNNTYNLVDVLGNVGIWSLDARTIKSYLEIIKEIRIDNKNDVTGYPLLESLFSSPPLPSKLCQFNDDSLFKNIIEENLPLQCYFDTDIVMNNALNYDRGIINPPSVAIHINNICNFSCKWCYADIKSRSPHPGLDTSVIYANIIKPMADMGNLAWYLAGGEPGMTPAKTIEISSLITNYTAVVSEHKPLIALETNGTNFVKNAYNYKNAGINTVQFSLSAATPEVDHYFRRPPKGVDSVELVYKAIKVAKSIDLYCGINMVIWMGREKENNFDQIEGIINFASQLKADFVRITPVVCVGASTKNAADISPQDLLTIARKITWQSGEEDTKPKIFGLLPNIDQEEEKVLYDRPLTCRAGTCYLDIDHLGNIFPCSLVMPDFRIGNAIQEDIVNLWRFSPQWEAWRTVKDICSECASCHRRALCIGNCPARAWSKFRNLNLTTKPYQCGYHSEFYTE